MFVFRSLVGNKISYHAISYYIILSLCILIVCPGHILCSCWTPTALAGHPLHLLDAHCICWAPIALAGHPHVCVLLGLKPWLGMLCGSPGRGLAKAVAIYLLLYASIAQRPWPSITATCSAAFMLMVPRRPSSSPYAYEACGYF